MASNVRPVTVEPLADAPEPGADVPAGRGTELAGWAIAAIGGHPATADGLDPDAARRLRRVNDAIAALQAVPDTSGPTS